ncbi:uncharacterized protein HMPREF1541_04085 [Cyphellophora europaea CBS 101466]|uniref:Uncharacterized protein n=1 Tax=Cyphellophora europaea (strain CBS 101466) TaxID=1220924 RepID=W2S2F3_CYPE1|nr:uncharacterized protein HMPREF1541_04085 [Cyphellophora europaea CBS 101466]ETN42144.1 hypothetical protein HMPREF1541_04085 [Cyphellophora europaea CBS 101466]
MAQFFQPGMVSQAALTGQYSTLYQERLYLLNALADDESQGERLTYALAGLQAQLDQNESADLPLSSKKLKQQVKAVRNKIGACQHRERALASNLTSITAQMEGMKRYQWLTAQHEYAMQIHQAQQHAHRVLMSPARPDFALRSPGTMDLATQMQFMSLGQPVGQQYANRGPLGSYSTVVNQPLLSAQLAVPFPDFIHHGQLYINIPPVLGDLQACEQPTEPCLDYVDSPMTASSAPRTWGALPDVAGCQRSASMLLATGSTRLSFSTPVSPVKAIETCAIRRLSLLDGTSAAMKLERKAAEAESRGLADGKHTQEDVHCKKKDQEEEEEEEEEEAAEARMEDGSAVEVSRNLPGLQNTG